jgi:hypothetical protein
MQVKVPALGDVIIQLPSTGGALPYVATETTSSVAPVLFMGVASAHPANDEQASTDETNTACPIQEAQQSKNAVNSFIIQPALHSEELES